MKIKKVTFTGADDSIKPEQLFEISEKYPFVEWALLASRNSQGGNRFPSLSWLAELHRLHYFNLNLALHLCGTYVKEILMGGDRFIDELHPIIHAIKRIQINTHGYKHQFDKEGLSRILTELEEIEFIFQYDNANADILKYASDNHQNISTLFDLSHGAGVSPKYWPLPILNINCGYAGGLSPENIESQLQLISEVADENEIWIDMETHVRSNNDSLFDLEKVKLVLDKCLASGFIK